MKKMLVLLVVLGFAGVASAAGMIGVNMGSNEASLASTDVAGVAPQDNWNNAPGGSGNLSNVVDDDGLATSADASWSSWGTWHCNAHLGTDGHSKMMYGYLDPVWGDWSATVTISDIPYDLYNVIVYVGTNNNGMTSHVTDGTTTYSYTVQYPINTPIRSSGSRSSRTDDHDSAGSGRFGSDSSQTLIAKCISLFDNLILHLIWGLC